MQIIQKKGNMNNYFIIYMRNLTYLNIKCILASATENGAPILYFKKTTLKIKKKMKSVLIFLSFL